MMTVCKSRRRQVSVSTNSRAAVIMSVSSWSSEVWSCTTCAFTSVRDKGSAVGGTLVMMFIGSGRESQSPPPAPLVGHRGHASLVKGAGNVETRAQAIQCGLDQRGGGADRQRKLDVVEAVGNIEFLCAQVD